MPEVKHPGRIARSDSTAMRNTKRTIAAYHRALGQSQDMASKAAGCSPQSISQWETQADPAYTEAFDKARRQLLREGWGEAWHTLRNSLRSDDESIQVRAAQTIVNAVAQDYPSKHEVTGADGGPIEERRYVIVRPIAVEDEDAN